MSPLSDDDEDWQEISPVEKVQPLHDVLRSEFDRFVPSTDKATETNLSGYLQCRMTSWTICASVLEMMHLYSLITAYATQVTGLCDESKKGEAYQDGTREKSNQGSPVASSSCEYVEMLRNAALQQVNSNQSAHQTPHKRKPSTWITLSESLRCDKLSTPDSTISLWTKATLRAVYESQIPHQANCRPWTDLFIAFMTACMQKLCPVRLCFSLGPDGRILRESASEPDAPYDTHTSTTIESETQAGDSHCSLWCEVFCVEYKQWLPVLPSIEMGEQKFPKSVHHTWGSPYSIAVGSCNSLRPIDFTKADESTQTAHSAQVKKNRLEGLTTPISCTLRLYTHDVTPKYTSNYLQAMSKRKRRTARECLESSDDSDATSDEFFAKRDVSSASEARICRVGEKFGVVESVHEVSLAVDHNRLADLDENILQPSKDNDAASQFSVQKILTKLLRSTVNQNDSFLGQSSEAARTRRILQRTCPIPSSLHALRGHPLYVVQEHLSAREAIRLRSASDTNLSITSETPWESIDVKALVATNSDVIAGLLKNTVVFHRNAIRQLRTTQEWLAQRQLVPKANENPVRWIHSKKCSEKPNQTTSAGKTAQNRVKRVVNSQRRVVCACPRFYGRWQLEEYNMAKSIPNLVHRPGKAIPRNSYGNFDLFMPNGVYRLFRSFEQKSTRSTPSDTLFYKFLSDVHTFMDETTLHRLFPAKVGQFHWWCEIFRKFPHDTVVKKLTCRSELEIHFPLLCPANGLVYLPYTSCARVLDAENTVRVEEKSRRARRKRVVKRGKGKQSARAPPVPIDYVPVVINFDRITNSLYLPRKQGVIISEKDFIQSDYPNLHKKWVVFWYLRHEWQKRRKAFETWRIYFQFLASRAELQERYGLEGTVQ